MGRINSVIEVKDYNPLLHGKNTVIGVLDIYGFEIFDNNRLVSYREVFRVCLFTFEKPIKVLVLNARTFLTILCKTVLSTNFVVFFFQHSWCLVLKIVSF